MKLFSSYLRLIRPFNLIMIVFTLYMVRLFFILPVFNFSNFPLQVSGQVFALFALSFALIAAGGYIINDYYDIEIDRINKPGRVIIGNTISVHSALTSYYVLSTCGLITGAWSCCKAGAPLLELLFVFYVIGLWYYSYKLKLTFLIGNIAIAAFLGLVPLASAYIEMQADNNTDSQSLISSLQLGVCAIALFAFLSTLIREMVKDMEDVAGDHTAKGKTMPIVWGVKKAKKVVALLVILMMVLLGILQQYAWSIGWHSTVYYIFILVQIPCFIILFKVGKSVTPKKFHETSIWLKIVMVTGICYLFVFAYESYIMLQFIKKLGHIL